MIEKEIKIKDLLIRKCSMYLSAILILIIVLIELMSRGESSNMDVKKIYDVYILYTILYGVGILGILIIVSQIREALKSYRLYAIFTIAILVFVSYKFVMNYQYIISFINNQLYFDNFKSGKISPTEAIIALNSMLPLANSLLNSTYYLVGQGIIQFVIGLFPEEMLGPIGKLHNYNKEAKSVKTAKEVDMVKDLEELPLKSESNSTNVLLNESVLNESVLNESVLNESVLNESVLNESFLKEYVLYYEKEKIEIELSDNFTMGSKTGNSFIINNTFVDSNHAIITKKDNSYYFMDLNTTNRSYINGEELEANINYILDESDFLLLANELFIFQKKGVNSNEN